MYRYSFVFSCLKCVEASEVCGWCVHDRICTGNPTSCRHEEDWRTIDVSVKAQPYYTVEKYTLKLENHKLPGERFHGFYTYSDVN